MSASNTPNTALWRARRKSGLERKQSGRLLGHRGADAVARYERGDAEPNLDNAIKLAIIYGCGIEDLFPLKYAAFRLELGTKALPVIRHKAAANADLFSRINVCTYEDALHEPHRCAEYSPHVRDHITKLAKQLAGL